jgi:rhodanese-related sulfurtransferase
MADQLISLAPADVERRVRQGHALLLDIREPDEFARRHIEGAVSQPLSRLGAAPLPALDGADVIYTCKTGMRTGANAARLAATVTGQAYVLAGGVDGWAKAGLPLVANAKAPLEMMRQVQIAAGLLVLIGVLLGWFVTPGFFVLAGFVGAGLTFAGVSGFCGMARLLAVMPWNRVAA